MGEEMVDFIEWPVRLSFPLCGNELYKLLDSGLRRHDEGVSPDFYWNNERDCGQTFVRYGKGAVGMATRLFSPCCHSSEGWNPGRQARVVNEWPVLSDARIRLSFPPASRRE